MENLESHALATSIVGSFVRRNGRYGLGCHSQFTQFSKLPPPAEFIQAGWTFLPSVYAYRLSNQMPELKSLLPPTPPSLLLTGPLCFDFCQAEPVGWWNWLEEVEVVLILVLHLAAEVAICAPASDWSGGRHRPREGSSTQLVWTLKASLPTTASTAKYQERS